MSCNDLKQYVSSYIDKELPSNMEDEFKEHLRCCEECKKGYKNLEEVHTL